MRDDTLSPHDVALINELIESATPCDHDHCAGCSCACHYADAVDAETERVFDQRIIAVQGESLRAAATRICDLTESRNTWRDWCLLCVGVIVLRIVVVVSVWRGW